MRKRLKLVPHKKLHNLLNYQSPNGLRGDYKTATYNDPYLERFIIPVEKMNYYQRQEFSGYLKKLGQIPSELFPKYLK